MTMAHLWPCGLLYPLGAFLTSLFLGFLIGPLFMCVARKFFRAPSRELTPEGHRAKSGVPTMGGLYIVAIFTISSLILIGFSNPHLLIMLGCLFGFGCIGFSDDWCKIRQSKGIWARSKFGAQWAIAAAVIISWLSFTQASTVLTFAGFSFDLGWFYIPWAMFILVATSNAVNLTDGLDGLAASCLIPNFFFYGFIALFSINLYGADQLSIMAAAMIGALLCFLWLNAHPAHLFMGDVGSLSLGAGLALSALMAKQELLLLFTGFIFVTETISVILQVFWYKRTKIRIFKMAPVHHHFEMSGWSEAQIMMRASIITIGLSMVALLFV